MTEVASIYNNLFSFESKKIDKSYPVHKNLRFDDNKGLLDFVTSKIDFKADDKVLDAGCGNGHSLFYLYEKFGLSGLGISLSENEIEFAEAHKIPLDDTDCLKFKLANFDDQFSGLYDKILAIESLKHSQNLNYSINNLFAHLRFGGTMIIADDYFISQSKSVIEHKKMWNAESFTSADEIEKILNRLDNSSSRSYDFSEIVPVRSKLILVGSIHMIDLALRVAGSKYRRNLKTYKGALLLENMYRVNQARYKVYFIKKL